MDEAFLRKSLLSITFADEKHLSSFLSFLMFLLYIIFPARPFKEEGISSVGLTTIIFSTINLSNMGVIFVLKTSNKTQSILALLRWIESKIPSGLVLGSSGQMIHPIAQAA